MEHTLKEKIYIANNRPFMRLIGLKGEPTLIKSDCLTENDFYVEGLKEKKDSKLYGYFGVALTLQFENLGNDEMPVSIGFNKFAQFVGNENMETSYFFDTPEHISPIKKNKNNIYEKTYYFICQPCKSNNDSEFEKFKDSIKNESFTVVLNIVCENGLVKESFESVGWVLFTGEMYGTDEFSKDRRSYSIIKL